MDIRALREVGSRDAAAAGASLDAPAGVTELLRELRSAGARDATATLGTRTANAGMFQDSLQDCSDDAARYRFGREPDWTGHGGRGDGRLIPARPWSWKQMRDKARQANLDETWYV